MVSSKSLFRPTSLSVLALVRPSVCHKIFFSLKSPWNHLLTPMVDPRGWPRVCPRHAAPPEELARAERALSSSIIYQKSICHELTLVSKVHEPVTFYIMSNLKQIYLLHNQLKFLLAIKIKDLVIPDFIPTCKNVTVKFAKKMCAEKQLKLNVSQKRKLLPIFAYLVTRYYVKFLNC